MGGTPPGRSRGRSSVAISSEDPPPARPLPGRSTIRTMGRIEFAGDAALVAMARAGDTEGFTILYRRHFVAVHRVVAQGVHNGEDRNDVVQEVFTRALERLVQLRNDDQFRPWLLTIARNTVIDLQRVGRRSPARQTLDDVYATTELSAIELAELAEVAEVVHGCVSRLSTRDAAVVTMVTVHGFSTGDVARAVGVNEATARVILHRARRRLRDALVLQALVRGSIRGCSRLDGLVTGDESAGFERHARSCSECLEIVRNDLRLRG